MADPKKGGKSNLWKWLLGCGCAVALVGAVAIGGIIWYASQSFTQDPVKAKEIADSIVSFDVPDGHRMIFGMAPPFIGWKMAAFGNKPQNPDTMCMMMLFPKSMSVNRSQMEAQMNAQAQQRGAGGGQLTVEDKSEGSMTVAGQETKLIEKVLVNQQGGGKVKQYTFMLTQANGTVMIIFQSPLDDFDQAAWTSFVASLE